GTLGRVVANMVEDSLGTHRQDEEGEYRHHPLQCCTSPVKLLWKVPESALREFAVGKNIRNMASVNIQKEVISAGTELLTPLVGVVPVLHQACDRCCRLSTLNVGETVGTDGVTALRLVAEVPPTALKMAGGTLEELLGVHKHLTRSVTPALCLDATTEVGE